MYEEQLAMKHKFVSESLIDMRKWISGMKRLEIEVTSLSGLSQSSGNFFLCLLKNIHNSPYFYQNDIFPEIYVNFLKILI